ncbi:MAG: T9SS type B sorting domain-containing protein, partial [Bacteroidota bacterium]
FTDSTSILCYGDNNGSITVTPSGGIPGYTYFWDGGATPTDSVATGLSDGTYTVIVTDNNGCSSVDNITLNEPTELLTSFTDSTSILCYGDNNGSITVTPSGGTSGYTYLWDGGSTPTDSIATGLSTGAYTVIVTDNNGCTIVDNITIDEPELLSLSINTFNNETCGGANGMAMVTVTGGTSPYNYLWNDSLVSTDSVVTGLNSGYYTVYVSDDNGCNDSVSVYIDDQGGGTISIDNVNDVLCYEDNNGAIVVTISSGTPDFTFYWSTDDTVITSSYTDTLLNLLAGDYTVTVIDANGCSSDTIITVIGPTEPLASNSNVFDVSCYGMSDGQINMNTTGGTPPFLYEWWLPGFPEIDSIYYDLPEGTYAVTITDANGCTVIIPKIDVEEPDSLIMIINNFPPACYGDTSGIIGATITGGTIPYTYAWNNVDWPNTVTDTVLIGVTAGSYSLTVTDAHSCIVMENATIYNPTEIKDTIEVVIEADYTGSAELTVSGGNPPYWFVWSNGDEVKDIVGLESGIYIVTITDGNLCTITDSIEIIIPLIIPTLFTPNGDNFNDSWRITNISYYENVTIEIFNRWGDLIFNYSGSGEEYDDFPWDGKYNGVDLPMSSFVYIIDLKNGIEPYTGVVSIKL